MKNKKPNNVLPPEAIEELIERKRKNLEAIFDAVPVGLLLVDENLTVVRVNDAIRRLVKKDYTEIINKPLGDALGCQIMTTLGKTCGSAEYCKKCSLKQYIRTVLKSSKPVNEIEFQSETHFQNRNTKLWFALSIEPVSIEGRKHVVVCLDDITAKKLAEGKFIETMEMKSKFISTVSHELKTPLSAIKEGLDIVLQGEAGRLKPKQKQFLELSKRNVDRLNMLVSDVLDIQKLESGTMEFDFSIGDMAETVREAVGTMSLAAKKARVDVSVEIKPDFYRAVFDRNRIIQLVTNLLSNAIKFTLPGGKITAALQSQNDDIVIIVSDTGMGIPKEDLLKIFHRFYRVRRPGKEIPGTGLGLSIIAQIVINHGGRIMVDSEPNIGTTFTVCLPKNPPKNIDSLDDSADQTLENTIS